MHNFNVENVPKLLHIMPTYVCLNVLSYMYIHIQTHQCVHMCNINVCSVHVATWLLHKILFHKRIIIELSNLYSRYIQYPSHS